jgi:hypothetical protein
MPTSKVHAARSRRDRRDGDQVHEGVRQEAGRGEGEDVQLPERSERLAPKSGRVWKF